MSLSSQMMTICHLKHRKQLSASKGSKLPTAPMHLLNHALDTSFTSLWASRLIHHIHSHSIPSFHCPETTAGATMAFSSSHTHALALLKNMADASDVMTWVMMNMLRRLSQGIQVAYMRTHHLFTMVLVALLTLYTRRDKQ